MLSTRCCCEKGNRIVRECGKKQTNKEGEGKYLLCCSSSAGALCDILAAISLARWTARAAASAVGRGTELDKQVQRKYKDNRRDWKSSQLGESEGEGEKGVGQ